MVNLENKIEEQNEKFKKIEDFINRKIDIYESEKRILEEKLKNSEDRKYLKLLIKVSIIAVVLLLILIFHSDIYDIIKYL